MEDPSAQKLLILVDREDQSIGFDTQVACHRHPMRLHRAFSIFLYDKDGRMLITKRSGKKKTWPGYWSNACCSHPRKGESTMQAARRRLREELGISTELSFLFKFEYHSRYDKLWGEHELDHVFLGEHDGPLIPDANEVEAWEFVNVDDLKSLVRKWPDRYTPWFKISLERVLRQAQAKRQG